MLLKSTGFMYYLAVCGLTLVNLFGWMLTLFGFPGNWWIVCASGLFAFFVHGPQGQGLTGMTVGILVALALTGELLETLSGAAGLAKGGSKRGALYSMVGSLFGGFLGAAIGLPIPLFGSLIAAVLFSALGALVGAGLGEHAEGKGLSESVRLGKVAFFGRLLGTAAKAIVGAVLVALSTVAALMT